MEFIAVNFTIYWGSGLAFSQKGPDLHRTSPNFFDLTDQSPIIGVVRRSREEP